MKISKMGLETKVKGNSKEVIRQSINYYLSRDDLLLYIHGA